MSNEQEKELAGRAAAQLVHDGDIVGLGTGSTAYYAVIALGERVKAGLKILGIPTSDATAKLAGKLGIPLTTLEENPVLDIDIDGADEVDPQLRLIKGGGGALLREKIIASASRKFVVVTDSSKIVRTLGQFPLPVEIIDFARPILEKKIAALGATVKLRLKSDGTPFVTDEGHHILDSTFGKISNPPALARTLSELPGVVEHGLFIGLAKQVFVGRGSKVEIVRGTAEGSKHRQQKRTKKRTRR